MGWLSTSGASRSDIISNLTKTEIGEHGTWDVLAHCTRSNVLWTVNRYRRADGTESKEIVCNLLQKLSEGWGWKDISESSGPSYFTCPLTYFALAGEADLTDTGRQWRKECAEAHARIKQARDLKRGDVVKFETPLTYNRWAGAVQVDTFRAHDAAKGEFVAMTEGKNRFSVHLQQSLFRDYLFTVTPDC